MNGVGRRDVTGAIAAMDDGRTGCGEESIGSGNTLNGFDGLRRLAVILAGQSFDLLDIDRIALHEGDSAVGLFAGFLVEILADHLVGIDH